MLIQEDAMEVAVLLKQGLGVREVGSSRALSSRILCPFLVDCRPSIPVDPQSGS
jgi:hypothetical protein